MQFEHGAVTTLAQLKLAKHAQYHLCPFLLLLLHATCVYEEQSSGCTATTWAKHLLAASATPNTMHSASHSNSCAAEQQHA
jgi:hypothetical protein